MRALVSLCAMALLIGSGCSRTDDSADNVNPALPSDQPAPTTTPPTMQGGDANGAGDASASGETGTTSGDPAGQDTGDTIPPATPPAP